MEKKSNVGDLAKITRDAQARVQEWLAVLARCFQLQDALAVLELDRVLDASPDDLDRHRVALQTARRKRREQIASRTERLLARMDAAADKANTQVLLHPLQSGAVIKSSNHVASDLVVFNERLGVEGAREALEAKRWAVAAGEVRDKMLETGADGVETAKRLGGKTLAGARLSSSKLASGLSKRLPRRGVTDAEQKNNEEEAQ